MNTDEPVLLTFIRSNYSVIILGLGGLLLIGYGLFQVFSPKDSGIVIEKSSAENPSQSPQLSPTATKKIIIDVEGAVEKPGLYTVAPDAREQDAIRAAGGLNKDADQAAIAKGMNMAAHLSDGMKLYLPFQGEQPLTSTGNSSVAGASTASISLNSATESQLDSLPGVGSVTAEKIIQSRPYVSIDELLIKKAVTKSTFEKIKDLVSL